MWRRLHLETYNVKEIPMTIDRVTTPFGAETTAAEVLDGVDLSGKRAVVTGGASGLGLETARALAGAGAEVTLAVRSLATAESAIDYIQASHRGAAVSAMMLDLASPGSVQEFVSAWQGPLQILVNNAGIMANPEARTPEGWELQFATNHLGHFALSTGLHGALVAAQGARVVSVSSVGHVNADVDFSDINFERRPYDAFEAYGQSKTANVLFAVEAAKRWAADGIAVNALNPGRILGTNLIRHIGTLAAAPASFDPTSADVSYKNPEQGAATSTLLAASPLVDGVTGRYFEDCEEAVPYTLGVRRGVASWALDSEHAAQLWQVSLEMLEEAQRDA
jgi:NAD(P)-dependent dehydrogenase (short-subunit alcohol dehydrogenase family)